MPKDTKTLGNNKARACESLGFVYKKRLCQRFDTTSTQPKRESVQLRTDFLLFSSVSPINKKNAFKYKLSLIS